MNLDAEDIEQLKTVIEEINRKNRVNEQRRDKRKEQKEKPKRVVHLTAEYGLSLFSGGVPLLFAGLILAFTPKASVNYAFIAGGVASSVFGFIVMLFAKPISNLK